jgi:hypothetical protein
MWSSLMTAKDCFVIALAFLLTTLGSAARAADLTGVSISAQWFYPDASTVIASQQVIDGLGVEIACPGSGSFCSAWGSTVVSYDFGPNSISFNAPNGTGHAAAVFNGYSFSGLAAGGSWAAATVATNIASLDASRLTFDGNTATLNVQGLSVPSGGQWTITLTSAVPENSSWRLLLGGLPLIFGLKNLRNGVRLRARFFRSVGSLSRRII